MSDFPHQYALYGLTVRSNRPIPGTPPAIESSSADLIIDFAGALEEETTPPVYREGFETFWQIDPGTWMVRYDDPRNENAWTVRYSDGGNRLTVRWSAEYFIDDIPPVLQGPGVAAALHLRGVPILHGCAVAVDDGAIIILGAPGAGKSTTAAACVRAGHALLSDDLAALDLDSPQIRVHPGYARLRMYADSASAAGFPPDALARVFVSDFFEEKWFVELGPGSFQPDSRPLRAIYFLEARRAGLTEPVITAQSRSNALPLLMRNVYSGRFLDHPRRARVLAQLARVAESVPVLTVEAGDDLGALPKLVKAITDSA